MMPRIFLKPPRAPRPSIALAALAALVLPAMVLPALVLAGCKGKEQGDGAPPPNPQVIQVADMNLITIDQKDVSKFPLAAAEQTESASALKVTGTVFPDVSRE